MRNPISQFTTTTTATGLPNINQDPVERKRSVAPRDLKARISVVEGRPSVHQLPPNFRGRIGSVSSPLTRSASVYSQDSTSDTDGGTTTTVLPTASATDDEKAADQLQKSQSVTKRLLSESDSTTYVDKDESNAQRRSSEGSVLLHRRTGSLLSSLDTNASDVIIEEGAGNNNINSESEDPAATPLVLKPPSFPANKVSLFNPLVMPSTDYSVSDYQQNNIDLFDHVMEWDFPIFDLNDVAGKHILSHVSITIIISYLLFILLLTDGLLLVFGSWPHRYF